MSQTINLETCSFDALRLIVPMWSVPTLKEALGIFEATMKKHSGNMDDPLILELLRKETICRHELHRRMRRRGIARSDMFVISRRLIGDRNEAALKMKGKLK